jgi:hypothetical protein
MRLRSIVPYCGVVLATSFVLVTSTSCGRVGGLVDDVVENVGPAVKGAAGTADNVPVPPVNSGSQSLEVVEVIQKSDGWLKAVVENAAGQALDVAVDCATGSISPSDAIPSAQQDDLIQSVCSQVTGNAKPADGVVRMVSAGEGYANLRSAPSTETSTIAQIPNGTSVKLIEKTQNSSGQLWYKVEANGQVGWIYSGLLD